MNERALPRVTVITAVLNRAELVEQSIQSVLTQDYPDLEYIVLDDGSTDDTLAVVKRYEDRLRWTSHPNMGEHRTVNRGFELATGEIIGVVASDDLLEPGAVRAVAQTMAEHPEAIVVYPDWDNVDEHGALLYHVQSLEYSYLDMVRWVYCLPGPGAFFRRSVVEALGGRDPTFRYVSDLDFWLRAGLVGPFRRIPRTLYRFRRHPGSLSVSDRGEAMAREHIHLLDKFFARADLPAEVVNVRTEAYRNAYFVCARILGANPRDPEQRFAFRDRLTERVLQLGQESPEETVGRLHLEVAQRDKTVEWLHGEVAQRDETVAWLHREVAQRDQDIARLRGNVAGSDRTAAQTPVAGAGPDQSG